MADSAKLTEPRPLLDDVLPRFDFHEIHETRVPAPVDAVYAAVKQVTAEDVRLLMPLEALRRLPRLLIGRRPFRPNPSAPLLEAFTAGVVPLGERPGREIVAGAVGRFWRPVGNEPAPIRTPEEFLTFTEPGYAKAAIAFTVSPEPNGSRVRTETRVAGTSPEATRVFRRYWLLIRPASGAIRRSWLAAIRRRAAHGPVAPVGALAHRPTQSGHRSMEHLWSRAVATSGNRWQMRGARTRLKQAKTVAVGCNQLP